jgi:hypothetical protein
VLADLESMFVVAEHRSAGTGKRLVAAWARDLKLRTQYA